MSNPDSPGPYWQEPAGVSRRAARGASGREDPYQRDDRYGRPPGHGSNGNGAKGYGAANGYGPANGGYPAGNGAGYPAGNGGNGHRRGSGNGSGRPPGAGVPEGHGRPPGAGADRYGTPDRYGRGTGRVRRDPGTQDDPGDERGGRRRLGATARVRGAQIGSDLRARLGLGARDDAYADERAGVPAGGPLPPAGPGPRGTRGRGQRADAELRARLGLRGGPRSRSGPAGPRAGGAGGYDGAAGYAGAAAGGAAAGYAGGAAGYPAGGPAGYPGPAGYGGDPRGYGTPDGRGTTALRERGTSRFPEATRPRGKRRRGDGGDGGSGDGWDGGGRRPRRKGNWWRHWTWKKALAVVAGLGVFMVILFAAVVVYMYEKTQIPTDVSEAALQQSSTVYFSNGKTEVGTFTADGIDRQILNSNQIPAVMKNAIVAAEDRHFYTEGGISVTGILRSAYEDLKGGGNLQGGSTLTEEFAKNYYATIGTSRTLSTKIKEIFVSIKLSHEKSKDWIITQYLNTVPFGNNAYGVAAASQLYFGEPAMKLSVSQSAMLAAMVNQPGFFNPNPDAGAAYTALVARWHYVLTNMVRDGALTQQQANEQTFPKVLTENALTTSWTGFKGYIMQQVQNELKYTYGFSIQAMDTRGLKIVTTFNLGMMRQLYQAVNQNVARMRAEGSPLPWYAHVGAVLEKPGTGAILAMYPGPSYSASHCARIFCQLNMATQNREQVGSSFKPYVLATAVSEGMDVQNSILNGIEPMCIPPDSTLVTRSELSQPINPCTIPLGFEVNLPGENSGPLSVPKAAAISSDPAFEDLIHRAGTEATINMAKAFGVNTIASGLANDKGEVGMALGIASLTVEEQATTFATLANDGEYITPHVIASITENGNSIPLKITRRQVLTPAQAADVDYALSFDTQPGGTAFPNGVLSPGRPTIGKTGTTDDEKSAFFLGAIPQYSLAVGLFTNQQNGLEAGQTLSNLPSVNGQPNGDGGNWPATIWQTFMQSEFGNLPVEPLPTPDYVGFTKWDQVPAQPKKHKKQPNPGQCGPGHHHFGLCPPPILPVPTPPAGGPTPNPTPTPSQTVPPFGDPLTGSANGPLTASATAALLLEPAAEEPTTAAARKPGAT